MAGCAAHAARIGDCTIDAPWQTSHQVTLRPGTVMGDAQCGTAIFVIARIVLLTLRGFAVLLLLAVNGRYHARLRGR